MSKLVSLLTHIYQCPRCSRYYRVGTTTDIFNTENTIQSYQSIVIRTDIDKLPVELKLCWSCEGSQTPKKKFAVVRDL